MKVLSYLDCGCAVMEDGSRSLCPSCAEPQPIRMATVEHSEQSDELMRLRRLVRMIQGALGTEEGDAALVEVAKNAHTAELQNAKWEGVFEKRAAREHEMIDEAIDDFCDTVLAKLADLGVPETDNCDGDEDVSTILAGWINSRIEEVRDQLAALIDTAERTLDTIPHGSDRYDLAMRLDAAKSFLARRAAGAGGVGENAAPKEATDNDQAVRRAGGDV